MRHAITKMSHLHFTATEAYADRIRQMGEEPWRIVVSGAPGVEAIRRTPRTPLEELRTQLDISLDGPSLLVTYHPVPGDAAGRQPGIESLLKALEAVDAEILFTYPNADAGGRAVIEAIQAFVASHGRSRLFVNLGQPAFFTLMANVSSMVGNSSSGLLEAPSFELPVVNIGDRQRGRIRAANVIDADSTVDGIVAGIQQALDPAFRRGLGGLRNPYGTGEASAIIVSTLRSAQLGPNLLCKAFVTT
jgi:UDP-hydrolysing UDP-N-acetyl-D-glucosamine 2-epimerase